MRNRKRFSKHIVLVILSVILLLYLATLIQNLQNQLQQTNEQLALVKRHMKSMDLNNEKVDLVIANHETRLDSIETKPVHIEQIKHEDIHTNDTEQEINVEPDMKSVVWTASILTVLQIVGKVLIPAF